MAKLRMQVQRAEKASGQMPADSQGRYGYRNIFHGVACIVRNEGFLSLYKGAFSRILYHTPSTAITMSLFETSKVFVKDHFTKKNFVNCICITYIHKCIYIYDMMEPELNT